MLEFPSETFRARYCIHTARDITQSFHTFRFEKTRCDRTAVSAPAYDCHRHISRKSSDMLRQVRQRNIQGAIQMILTPFLGRANIQDNRTVRVLQAGEDISSSYLHNP